MEVLQKRIKMTEGSEGDGGGSEGGGNEMTSMEYKEMEQNIRRILEKIEHFTQQVGELLEAGRTLFRNLSSEFEERLLSIHKEQMEKWQEEIKELQSRDAANEAARALLGNAQHLLRSAGQESPPHHPLLRPIAAVGSNFLMALRLCDWGSHSPSPLH